MLIDVANAQLAIPDSRTENTINQRGSTIVTTIKPTGSPPLEDRTKAPERNVNRDRRANAVEADAVQFRREDTSLHRLYRSVRETEETSRAEKIEELRRAVKNGTYRPNLMVVAERLLSHGELGRF